ncbi:MAG: NADH-ubiquinone oxidoreductase-F iron-sulfur binding region domain-containing protein [Thermoleophilia bacterium]
MSAAPLPRLLRGLDPRGALPLDRLLAVHGPLPVRPEPGRPDNGLIGAVTAAGLRGRGGAGFPAGTKMAAVAARRNTAVVVNATEGEPVSGKDRLLLRLAPHLVLDGAVALAAAVGAGDAVVAVSEAMPAEHAALAAALRERDARSVSERMRIEVRAVPHRFVSGEETALISALNGGPGLPTTTPPRPFERGLGGRPTLVQNCETACQAALIARHGPRWFREVGTRDEPGSALVTLTGAVERPGVHEIALGMPLDDLLAAAGGPTGPVRAVLVGGYFGSWIDGRDVAGLPLSDAGLRAHGGALGARAIVVLSTGSCGVVELARVARYLARESAGQCGPCVNGLDAIAGGLERLARGDGRDLDHLERWLALTERRGACRHPDGAVAFIRSGLRVFAAEIRRHVVDRACTGDGRPVLPVPAGAAR